MTREEVIKEMLEAVKEQWGSLPSRERNIIDSVDGRRYWFELRKKDYLVERIVQLSEEIDKIKELDNETSHV
jgi:hypothetical protein